MTELNKGESMTREEAKIFLLQLHTDKQLNKSEHEALRIAVKALEQEPCREADDYENEISDLYNRLDIVEYDKERLREEVTTLEEKLKGLSAEPCEDAISRHAALDTMFALCDTGETLEENPWRDNPHIDAIIDALDNLPPVTPQPSEDAISRQAVIDVIERWLECSGYNEAERHIMRAVQSVLYDSPSVNPQLICEEREKGECPWYAG